MKNYLRISIVIVLISILNIKLSGLRAQIIYTDIQPDTTIVAPDNSWGMYYIDINMDGTNDFLLNHHNMLVAWNYQKVEMSSDHINAEVLCDNTYNHYPLAFSINDTIKAGSGNWFCPANGGFMIVLNDNGDGGDWIGVTNKYLAVRLKVGTQWHYGWIRLDVPADAGSYTVKDYAFNSVAAQEILAGNGSASTSVRESNKLTTDIIVYPNPLNANNTIKFNHIFNNLNISIYTINGKLIEHEENIKTNSYRIKNNLIKGLYLIKIETEQGVFFTKLMIN
jgi:hypothetical protein